MLYCLAALFLLLLLVWPYLLFMEAKRLDVLVPTFAYRVGRKDVQMLLMLFLYNGAAAFALYAPTLMRESPQRNSPTELLVGTCLLTLPFLAIAFVVNRLHFTYWRHDRYARLEVDKAAQRVVYTNQGQQLTFAVSEVVRIVNHSSNNGRAPWRTYEYEAYFLLDGTELLLLFGQSVGAASNGAARHYEAPHLLAARSCISTLLTYNS